MAGKLTIGLFSDIYYNSGTYAAPTWTAIPVARDVNLNLERGTAEVKSRNSNFAMTFVTFYEADLEFEILADTSEAAYTAMQAAFVGATVEDLAVADGPIATSGTVYWRADYNLTAFKRPQPLEGVNTIGLSAKLAYSTNPQGFTTAP